MPVFHMPHIDVHEGGSGKEMIRFTREDCDAMIREFSNMSGGGNASYSVTNYNDVLHGECVDSSSLIA